MSIRRSALLGVCLLTACAEPARFPAGGVAPRFELIALGRETGPAVPVTPVGTSSAEPVYGPGVLTVSLTGLLPAARRVLATMADVATVRVTVRFSVQGQWTSVVKTLDRTALDAGQTTVTFTGLPEGGVTVQVQALDASQTVIAGRVYRASVVAGAPAHLDVAVPLAPLASGGGSSGGGAAPTPTMAPVEGLVPQITLADGPAIAQVAPGTVLAQIGAFEAIKEVAVAPDGSLWAWVMESGSWRFAQYAPDGDRLATVSVTSLTPTNYMRCWGLDGSGRLWVALNDQVVRYGPDGTPAGTVAIASIDDLAFDAAGQAWALSQAEIVRVSSSGSVLGRTPLAASGKHVAVDSATGEAYVVGAVIRNGVSHRQLIKLLPTGEIDWRLDLGMGASTAAIDVMAGGHVWLAIGGTRQLLEVTADGTLQATYTLPYPPQQMRIDANETLWVATSGGTEGTQASLLKWSPDGGLLGEFRTVGAPASIDFDADGYLWVPFGGQAVRLAP